MYEMTESTIMLTDDKPGHLWPSALRLWASQGALFVACPSIVSNTCQQAPNTPPMLENWVGWGNKVLTHTGVILTYWCLKVCIKMQVNYRNKRCAIWPIYWLNLKMEFSQLVEWWIYAPNSVLTIVRVRAILHPPPQLFAVKEQSGMWGHSHLQCTMISPKMKLTYLKWFSRIC